MKITQNFYLIYSITIDNVIVRLIDLILESVNAW